MTERFGNTFRSEASDNEEEGELMSEIELLNVKSADYFNTFSSIIYALGSFLSGPLVSSIGFRSSCDLFAIVVCIYAVLLILLNGGCSIFKLSLLQKAPVAQDD